MEAVGCHRLCGRLIFEILQISSACTKIFGGGTTVINSLLATGLPQRNAIRTSVSNIVAASVV